MWRQRLERLRSAAVNDQLRRRSVGAPAARSLLLTLLGEYVLPRSDGVWQETVVAALGVLGYTPQAARQAISRSVRDGWLATERRGRRARMFLTDSTADLLSAGADRIYTFGQPWRWDGRWLLVVLRVPEYRREVRHQLRTRLAWAGLGSLGGGFWLTPHVDREAEVAAVVRQEPAAEVLSFHARLADLGEPIKVVRAAWDLDAITAQYQAFIEDFSRASPSALESCFRMQTELVHAWRKFPFLDPYLPEELLPARWPGRRSYRLFQSRHRRWGERARAYFEGLEA
jgi:phenylacetic acid degradation operon negative regulatory protein